MDALVSIVAWPVISFFETFRFSIGLGFSLLPMAFMSCRYGFGTFRSFEKLFMHLQKIPLGKYVFSGLAGFIAPYSASISPIVESLGSSTCTAKMHDRPWLRNPFSSVHAIALANLGEFTSGLAMMSWLQENPRLRGIPIKIETEYFKKARGTITAKGYVANTEESSTNDRRLVIADLYDAKGVHLAKCSVTWAISENKK